MINELAQRSTSHAAQDLTSYAGLTISTAPAWRNAKVQNQQRKQHRLQIPVLSVGG